MTLGFVHMWVVIQGVVFMIQEIIRKLCSRNYNKALVVATLNKRNKMWRDSVVKTLHCDTFVSLTVKSSNSTLTTSDALACTTNCVVDTWEDTPNQRSHENQSYYGCNNDYGWRLHLFWFFGSLFASWCRLQLCWFSLSWVCFTLSFVKTQMNNNKGFRPDWFTE